MPHIDFSTYASQLFWLAITFGIIYIMVSKLYAPKMHSLISMREQDLQRLINSSQELHEQTKALDATIAREDSELKERIASIKHEARAKATEILREAERQNQIKLAAAQDKYNKDLRDIASNMEEQVSQISQEISSDIASRLSKLYGHSFKF